jgi:hypothetical protein
MWNVGMAKPLTAESVLTDIQRTAVYFRVVIRSFRSGETERLFRREPVVGSRPSSARPFANWTCLTRRRTSERSQLCRVIAWNL